MIKGVISKRSELALKNLCSKISLAIIVEEKHPVLLLSIFSDISRIFISVLVGGRSRSTCTSADEEQILLVLGTFRIRWVIYIGIIMISLRICDVWFGAGVVLFVDSAACLG